MRPASRSSLSVAWLTLALACANAGPPVPGQLEGNPVFGGASLIEVARPAHRCVVELSPTFEWVATGRPLMMAAVFAENISIDEGRISNPQAAVWAWHSGLGRGRDGFVTWEQGVRVREGAMEPDSTLVPLTVGQRYVWAVWAWDDDGIAVVASSAETLFQVDSVGPIPRCDLFAGLRGE